MATQGGKATTAVQGECVVAMVAMEAQENVVEPLVKVAERSAQEVEVAVLVAARMVEAVV